MSFDFLSHKQITLSNVVTKACKTFKAKSHSKLESYEILLLQLFSMENGIFLSRVVFSREWFIKPKHTAILTGSQ